MRQDIADNHATIEQTASLLWALVNNVRRTMSTINLDGVFLTQRAHKRVCSFARQNDGYNSQVVKSDL